MGCSFVTSVFFVYCVIKRIVYREPRRYLYTKTRLRLWFSSYRKRQKQSVHVSSILQVSCSSNESAVQRELSICFACSICLSVQFDTCNVALALAARTSITEFPLNVLT